MEAIVVLGARVLAGGVPSGALRARVERAVELLATRPAAVLVLSGGGGAHRPPEAEVARALAVALGVTEDRCLVERQSRNTEENARFAAELLRGHRIEKVTLVTDPFHAFRAQRHFWRQGIDAEVVVTRWREREPSFWRRLRWRLREVPALLAQPALLFARRPRS